MQLFKYILGINLETWVNYARKLSYWNGQSMRLCFFKDS